MMGIYVRQSLDKKDSLSIESQIEDCINLCKRSGCDDYKIYKDKGWSAKNLERPSFKQLNKDVRSGLIDTVVCYKIDRISRNIRDLVNLIEDYSELGVHFISFADNINTAAPGGMMMATLFGSLAQMEREAIITRVTDNYYYRCELGYWGGGPAPYGYRLKKVKENGQKHTVLEIDEEEAKVVRQFFEWYLEPDSSIRTLLNMTSMLGMTTRKGALWTSRVLSDLLSKPLYAPNTMDVYNFYASQGVIVKIDPEQCDGKQSVNVFGKRDRNSAHPKRSRPVSEMTLALAKHTPIIDSDTFLKVQFKKKAKLAASPRAGTSSTTILSGLVKCGSCGRSMSPSGSRNGVRYFTCSGKRNYAFGVCTGSSVQILHLEKLVLQDLLQYVNRPEVKALFKTEHAPDLTAADNANINTFQQEVAKIDIEIGNLLDACSASGSVAAEYLNQRIENLDNKKKELMGKILEIKHKANNVLSLYHGIDIDSIPGIINHGDFDAKKYICNYFIKKVTFTNKNDILVEYKL